MNKKVIIIAVSIIVFFGSILAIILINKNSLEETPAEEPNNTVVENNETEEEAYDMTLSYEDVDKNKDKFEGIYSYDSYSIYNDGCDAANRELDVCQNKYGASLRLVNSSTKKSYITYPETVEPLNKKSEYPNYLFVDGDSKGLINTKYNTVITGYDEYSCAYYPGNEFTTCIKSDTTIVQKNKKFGVISLKDKYILLNTEYDYISEDGYGNFLVQKNDKMGLYSKTGKELLKLDYDFIGQNNAVGYIVIKGDKIEQYNKNIVSQTLSEKSLSNSFTKVTNSTVAGTIPLLNPDSYYWSGGSHFIKQDITLPYEVNSPDGSDYRFKYTGSKYTGTQFFIYSIYSGCYKTPYLYVVNGNTVDKIGANELDLPKNSDGSFKAFCYK